jgi:hypothetical protein
MASDIDSYNNSLSPNDKEICDLLRSEIDRELTEADSKVWHGHPVWFLDGNPVTGYAKRKNDVQLLFWSGQSFKAEGLEVEGTFKAAQKRYNDVSEINVKELSSWLKESRDVQWDYKNIVKRRGVLERLK